MGLLQEIVLIEIQIIFDVNFFNFKLIIDQQGLAEFISPICREGLLFYLILLTRNYINLVEVKS